LPSPGKQAATLLLVPTTRGVDACILELKFADLYTVSQGQRKTCFQTPDSFVSGGNFPVRPGWIDFQRTMFDGDEKTLGARHPAVTQQGVTILAKRILAQNSPSEWRDNKITLFGTGDPEARSHWLKQIRIGIAPDNSISAESRRSMQVKATVVTYHRCDRTSCLGCGSIKLQALCYAAQQCSVARCIGTVVNQNRPLCNLGLMAKSQVEETLSMMLGAWLIFTESYGKILDVSLLNTQQKLLNIEWVDDAFFGYICTAKDTMGQMTAVLTSSVGAGESPSC
jgi:hypothetical protein